MRPASWSRGSVVVRLRKSRAVPRASGVDGPPAGPAGLERSLSRQAVVVEEGASPEARNHEPSICRQIAPARESTRPQNTHAMRGSCTAVGSQRRGPARNPGARMLSGVASQ